MNERQSSRDGPETAALRCNAEATRPSALTPLGRWAAEIGRTSPTIWRWRKLGWIEVINVCGKLYVSDEAISRFNARAAAGEFSKVPVVPRRTREEAA